MTRITLLLLAVLWLRSQANAQVNGEIDSLEHTLLNAKSDSIKVDVLIKLSYRYWNKDIRRSQNLAREALHLATRSGDRKRISMAYNFLGKAYYLDNSTLDSSIWACEQSIRIAEDLNDNRRICIAYQDMGTAYGYMQNYKSAIDVYYKGLAVAEKAGLSKEYLYGSIATVYRNMKDHGSACRFDSLALAEADRINAPQDLKYLLLGNHAISLYHLRLFSKARKIVQECIAFRKSTNDKLYTANHYIVLANINLAEKYYGDAFQNLQQTLRLNQELGYPTGVATAYYKLGEVEFYRERIPSARKYATDAFALSDSIKNSDVKYKTALLLSKIGFYEQNMTAARHYDSLATTLGDSIDVQEQRKAVEVIEARHQTEKREKENEVLRLTQRQQESALHAQRYTIIFIVAILVVMIVLFTIIYRSRQMLRNTNALLERTQEEILAQQEHIAQQNEELQKTIDELRNAQQQLIHSEKMASLGQMTSGIAHEVNNPLNFISGGVESLANYFNDIIRLARRPHGLNNEEVEVLAEVEKDTSRLISVVKAGVDRARRIVVSLQTFSSPQKSFTKVNVEEVIEIALTLLTFKINSSQINVIRHYDDDPGLVLAHASEISQVIGNIVNNAIDAMENSERKDLTITTTVGKDGVIVKIADTGTGIAETLRQRIMDPFFTTKAVGKGTGLGLSISYSIVKAHGGRLTFESIEGKGTEFTLVLKPYRE